MSALLYAALALALERPTVGQCKYAPTWDDATLAERVLTCPHAPDLSAAAAARGQRLAPALVAYARSHPDVRGVALALFDRTGAGGEAAYALLGAELVDWLSAGATSGDGRADARRVKQLGGRAGERLQASLRLVCRTGQIKVIHLAAAMNDPAHVEPLSDVVARGDCLPQVRVAAARLLVRLDRARGVALIEPMLRDPAMSGWYGRLGEVLVTAGEVGVEPAIRVLQDPRVPRGSRAEIAEELRKTRIPAAVAAADRYEPSGWTGTGNPESSAGSWMAGCLFALGVGLAATLRGPRAVAPIERVLVVIGALFFAHMAFVLARPLMVGIAIRGSEGGGYILAFVVMIALAVWPVAAVRARITTEVAPAWMLAVGAAAGVLAGAFADSRVYWYELRNETWSATRFLSLLEVGIAFMATVVASYGPAGAEEPE